MEEISNTDSNSPVYYQMEDNPIFKVVVAAQQSGTLDMRYQIIEEIYQEDKKSRKNQIQKKVYFVAV